jgi:chemotaxis protein MotB
MRRVRGRRHQVEQDDVNRWLVSYADYMTLLFALFVVLYAMAMVNEKQFESVTDSIGRVFQADKDKTKNRGHGDDILSVNTSNTSEILYGNHVLDATGPELVDKNVNLSNVSDSEIGTNLASIQSELYTALYDLVESGLAQLQIDGDWLEIELNSGLLFPSGSSSATNTARELMSVIYEVVGKTSNFIRIRGYTDNQPISNEFFSSNWELSVFRATAILPLQQEWPLRLMGNITQLQIITAKKAEQKIVEL